MHARKILSNTVVQIFGKGTIAILGVITSKLLATYLTVSDRGQYELIYAVLAFAGIAADMGLFTIAIREISNKKDQMKKIIGNIMALRLVLAILMIFLAVGVVNIVPGLQHGPMFTIGVALAGVSTMLALMNGTITSILQVEYKMAHATISQVLSKVVIVIIMALTMFVYFKQADFPADGSVPFWAFEWLIIAGIIGNTCMYLYTNHFVKKYVDLKLQFDFDFWKKLIKDTLPYGLALILATLYFQADKVIISVVFPQDAGSEAMTSTFNVGLYSGAIKIVEIFAVLPLFFLNATLPLMGKMIKEGSEKIKTLIQYSFDFLLLLAAPIVTGGYVLAYHIINITNDEKYLSNADTGFMGADMILEVIIFALLFSFLNLLFNFLLVAQNKQYKLITINGISFLFNIVTNLIFIPMYGLMAAAVTTVLTEIIVLALTFYHARKGIDFTIRFERAFKIVVSVAVMGLVLQVTKDPVFATFGTPGILVLIVESAVIYLVLLLGLRVVTKDMIQLIKKT